MISTTLLLFLKPTCCCKYTKMPLGVHCFSEKLNQLDMCVIYLPISTEICVVSLGVPHLQFMFSKLLKRPCDNVTPLKCLYCYTIITYLYLIEYKNEFFLFEKKNDNWRSHLKRKITRKKVRVIIVSFRLTEWKDLL